MAGVFGAEGCAKRSTLLGSRLYRLTVSDSEDSKINSDPLETWIQTKGSVANSFEQTQPS